MYFFKITIVCLLLSCLQVAYAQSIDSLLSVRKQTKNKLEQFDLTIQLIEISTNKRAWKNSLAYSNEALQIATSLEDENRIGEVHLLLGRINFRKGDYLKADSLFLKALEYSSDKDLRAKIHSGRFSNVVRTGKLENGGPILKSMRAMITDTTSFLMGDYYLNMSNYYGEQHDILKALQYLQKTKKIFLEYGEDTRMINHNLTIIFEELRDYENILKIQTELRESAKKEKNALPELFSLFGIMTAQKGLKDYKSAKRNCYDAIKLKILKKP
jgi:tetratricopeptide (TPR) repeat protein